MKTTLEICSIRSRKPKGPHWSTVHKVERDGRIYLSWKPGPVAAYQTLKVSRPASGTDKDFLNQKYQKGMDWYTINAISYPE